MTPLIALHMSLALSATVAGAFALWARRSGFARPGLHRAAGYVFVISMLGAAATAAFLRDHQLLNWRGLTPIHLLIPLTVVGIWRALWLVRHGDIPAHRRMMQRVYLGACVLAGLFTLLPNRLIGRWFWSSLGLL